MRRPARLLLATLTISVALVAQAAPVVAGPPVMMRDGGTATGRLEGLMMFLAFGKLQRRPGKFGDAPDEPPEMDELVALQPSRLMGVASLERSRLDQELLETRR